ncbi:hypothetical protein BHE74_00024593 [Ensete ventricosum]|nr:hypothetical protein GW17_00041364 [Ensete ventricosum]RWW67935.1 hypothetical protein BHE74_00024593 [Ensete ventricosum]RZR87353.1 hypothetical protein BHM03_00014720 [Ensete ventricosum]
MASPSSHLPATPKILLRSSPSNPIFLASNRSLLFGDASSLSRRQRRHRAAALRGVGARGWSSAFVKAVLDVNRQGAALRPSEVKQRRPDDRPRGNLNWMQSREATLKSPVWRGRENEIRPFGNPKASDSANLDSAAEVLSCSF